jgi:hypothetical protein
MTHSRKYKINYGYSVYHPYQEKYTKSKTFTNKKDALEFLKKVNKKYDWSEVIVNGKSFG